MRGLHSILLISLLALASQVGGQSRAASTDANGRLQFTEKDLPSTKKDPAGPSEIDQSARAHGFNYAIGTRRAARGDFKLLKKFFELARDVDGAAAESFGDMPTVVYHLLGDEKFAQFLAAQPLTFRMMVRNQISHEGLPAPASQYLSRHFPQTTQLLFRREIVDWPWPCFGTRMCGRSKRWREASPSRTGITRDWRGGAERLATICHTQTAAALYVTHV